MSGRQGVRRQAARARIALDRKMGRETPAWVLKLARPDTTDRVDLWWSASHTARLGLGDPSAGLLITRGDEVFSYRWGRWGRAAGPLPADCVWVADAGSFTLADEAVAVQS